MESQFGKIHYEIPHFSVLNQKKYKVLDKNKETGDSNLFKDQAGSVSNAFKKLK